VWAAERPFVWNGIDVGGRSVIARLPKSAAPNAATAALGPLVVHSPVEWTKELGDAIDSLGGDVGVLIAPNYEHLKYIKQWTEIYPNAQAWACPGLRERLPEVKWTHEFDANVETNKPDGLQVLWLDCEINPFTNKAFFNEVVIYHEQSKSVVFTDAYWNYPASDLPNYDGETGTGAVHACQKVPISSPLLPSMPPPLGTRAWKLGMDKVYLPFYKALMVGSGGPRRERFGELVRRVLDWEVEAVVPCHGDVVRGRELCRRVLTEHFLG